MHAHAYEMRRRFGARVRQHGLGADGLMQNEGERAGQIHLQRRHADLAIGLAAMAIAHQHIRAGHEDREKQAAPRDQLFVV